MKLPNGENALIEIEKFSEYCLNPNHPLGQHKAHVFEAVLGLTLKDSIFLCNKVHEAAVTHEASQEVSSVYGERYVEDFELRTDVGTAIIRSGWIIR